MASKFTKFLTITAAIGAASAAGVALYKKYKDDKSFDDDFDDADFDDDLFEDDDEDIFEDDETDAEED